MNFLGIGFNGFFTDIRILDGLVFSGYWEIDNSITNQLLYQK
jgi:hypothetical protein